MDSDNSDSTATAGADDAFDASNDGKTDNRSQPPATPPLPPPSLRRRRTRSWYGCTRTRPAATAALIARRDGRADDAYVARKRCNATGMASSGIVDRSNAIDDDVDAGIGTGGDDEDVAVDRRQPL